MNAKGHRVLLALAIAGSGAGWASQQKGGEARTRDLSDMFYTDKLVPVKSAAAAPAVKPAVQAPKARPPVGPVAAPRRHVGLKYRILVSDTNCDLREVDSSYVFRSGEKIRLVFESNIDGYLYVLQRGSSGDESVLFPDSRINGGLNLITRGVQYSVPPAQWYIFDETPGEERLMVILSRTPLESLPQQAKPAAEPVTLLAVRSELDRKVTARDLTLLDETAPAIGDAPPKSQAKIVLNTSSERNDLAYTEIMLRHR